MKFTKTEAQAAEEFEGIAAVYLEARDIIMKYKGVIDVGIGSRKRNGELSEEMTLRVHVWNKVSKDALAAPDIVPAEVLGIPTDICEIECVNVMGQFTDKERPLKGGIKVGIGTLGCFANKKADGKLVLLSNAHVLYDSRASATVYQPDVSICCCCIDNSIGTVLDKERAVVYNDKNPVSGKMDAAIAEIKLPADCDSPYIANKIRDLGRYEKVGGVDTFVPGDGYITGVAPQYHFAGDKDTTGQHNRPGPTTVKMNEEVRKVGYVTGLTHGTVTGINDVKLATDLDGKTTRLYKEIITVTSADVDEMFVDSGDSGSVLINKQNQIVALVFAGTSFKADERPSKDKPGHGFACNIQTVLQRFNIMIHVNPQSAIAYTGPIKAAVPFNVTMDGSGSKAGDGTIISHLWRTGEKDTNGKDIVYNLPVMNHTFHTPGKYKISLNVLDSNHLSDISYIEVEALKAPSGTGSTVATTHTIKQASGTNTLETVGAMLSASPAGQSILHLIETNREEVIQLVRSNRKVMVAWQRKYGPQFVSKWLQGIQQPDQELPKEINGVTLQSLLQQMTVVLEEEGSLSLKAVIRKHRLAIFNFLNTHHTFGAMEIALTAAQ
jgi:hypothetical protein